MGFARIALAVLIACCIGVAPAHAFSDVDVIEGFERTVFGSEFALPFARGYVRKFEGPVRFYIRAEGFGLREAQVAAFVERLDRLVAHLDAAVVDDPADANFTVHVVARDRYKATVQRVLGRTLGAVSGRCMVRAVFSREGIERSDAIIVGDEGDRLFSRCMTEELLQGLGPLNDDPSLTHSMFNDASPFIHWQRFDRLIVNMLYDPRIENGAAASVVRPLLPAVLRDVRARIAARN